MVDDDLDVVVAGQTRIVYRRPGSPSRISRPVECGECGALDGVHLAVRGGDVTYTCPAGHTTPRQELSAPHVRRAIGVQANGQRRVASLVIADARMDPETDPTTVW